MEGGYLSEIRPGDVRARAEWVALLEREGIRRDPHLDYTVGLYDDEDRLVAAGSCFADTLRCLAVEGAHRGEGLLNRIVTRLVEVQMRRGNSRLFLYTRPDRTPFFTDLGFFEVARGEGVVFMENRRGGFDAYLRNLGESRRAGRSAALVMNANPFTLGHRYLAERASSENDTVHLFVVSEDVSLVPFADRFALIEAGCVGLGNVLLHRTDSYMISQAVFPSYFLEDEEAAIKAQARLDLSLFGRVASVLGVTRRYVGEEPFSRVTRLYNEVMEDELPRAGIELVVVPRLERGGQAVSASEVRRRIQAGEVDSIRDLVPPSTLGYFLGEKGREAVRRIRSASDVTHY